ncbi:hypothetical protein Tco_1269696 [Tanacetum coccineum]
MTTLAEFVIIAGVDNRPPMLEKSLYDSWKSRIEHYMENRENGRMILSSVQNGPLIWLTLLIIEKLRGIHNTFHVSNLKKCFVNDDVVIPLDEVQLDNKLHFVEEPVEIMDREVKRLKQSRIPIVKVRWNSRRGPEFTWEREDFFRSKYPYLFARRRVTRQDKRRDVAS